VEQFEAFLDRVNHKESLDLYNSMLTPAEVTLSLTYSLYQYDPLFRILLLFILLEMMFLSCRDQHVPTYMEDRFRFVKVFPFIFGGSFLIIIAS